MKNDVIFEKALRYEIFIGIKDKDRYQEIITVDDFRNMLEQICTEKQLAFSLLTQIGGYAHNKGYTTETSLRIVIIGADENEITILGERLKKKVNTDTILITKSDTEYAFV